MKLGGKWLLILLVFTATLGLRMFFAFQTPNFTGDESYYSLRQAEHIKETGLPLISDSLSLGGRMHIVSPVFYYLLAAFSFFMPLEIAAKIVPNVLANLVVVFCYLIALEITKSRRVAIFTSVASGFIPIYFTETVNSPTPITLFFPLFLALIYCFMNLSRGRKYANLFIGIAIIMSFTHPASYLVVAGFLIFALLVRLERIRSDPRELEAILFLSLFVLWSQMIILKQAFLTYGPAVVFQNIPHQVLSQYFNQFSLLEAIVKIGIIPLVFGIYVIYKYSFKERVRDMYLLLSFVIVAAPLLWLRLMPLSLGLMLLGIMLILFFAQYIKLFLIYIKKTRFSNLESFIIVSLAALFVLTSLIWTLFYAERTISDAFSDAEIRGMAYLKENAPEGSVVLASYDEGNLLMYETGLRSVIDRQFLLADRINQRYRDVKEIYSTGINTEAIKLLNKYDVDYILVSPRILKAYRIDEVEPLKDSYCFEEVYDREEVRIFRPLCRLEKQQEQ